jgi:hypothetical protein
MDFFANIIILPMLGYFQLFFIVLSYFTLHYLRLFMVIFSFLGYFKTFRLRLISFILSYFLIF